MAGKNGFLNADLIGKKGSRERLQTPALVLDLDLFEKNVETMADHVERHGLKLRPHAKTHKSATVARKQLEAGAIGICCAKLGEAEALAAQGIDEILLTSPVVTEGGIGRIRALDRAIGDLIVVCDHPENADALNAAASEKRSLKVIVDVDVGLHRTGAPPDKAQSLAEKIAGLPNLTFMGLQGYAGHLMHLEDFVARREKSLECMETLKRLKTALEDEGILCPVVTGGGTGSYNIDPEASVLTDLQGGSYIFMDKQYNDVPIANAAPMPFETALSVQMTVISVNTPGLVTTDAGYKSFSTDADPPVLLSGAPEGASYMFFGDEQGAVVMPDKQTSLPLGSVVTAVTPHCDPTVNLYDCYHVVRGDTLVEIWPIEARGRSA